MRAVLVVVLDEVVEEPVELVLVPDQCAVEEFVADGSHPSFSKRVRFGAPGGVLIGSAPTAANTLSNARVYWPAPSRITNWIARWWTAIRFRAAWVVQGPVAAEFALDAPVALRRVLAIETEYESADLCWCGWSAGSRCRWLGPVAGDETAVPSDHGGGFDDQHHGCESGPVEGGREHRQDGPVGGCESGTVDLSLQHEDLMSKGQDFGVTLVAGHEEQAEASNR